MACLGVVKTANDVVGECLVPPGLHFVMPGSRRIWVDSTDTVNAADKPNYGTFENPYLTIKYAMTFWKDGDTIICKPNHVETIDGTLTPTKEPIVIDKNYVSLIGMGQGRMAAGGYGMPRITVAAASEHTTLVEVTGTGVRIHGMLFSWTGNLTGGKTGISIDVQSGASGFLVTGCKFTSASTGDAPGIVELVEDDFAFIGNHAESVVGTAEMRGLVLVKTNPVSRLIVKDNVIESDDAHILESTSQVVLDAVISGNFIKSGNSKPIAGMGVDLPATSTGILWKNHIGADDSGGDISTTFDNRNLPMIENYATKDFPYSGVLAN